MQNVEKCVSAKCSAHGVIGEVDKCPLGDQ
jgi:hypothetical protein